MIPTHTKIEFYDYYLPDDRIAKFPLAQRDTSKLLVYNNKTICETVFKNLAQELPEACTLVVNNTRVVQARLLFKTQEHQSVEVFCLEPHSDYGDVSMAMLQTAQVKWRCLIGNLRKWKKEETLMLHQEDFTLSVKQLESHEGDYVVLFSWTDAGLTFAEVLDKAGILPIPPYLKRETQLSDTERYQTIYANQKGSVAAPTAGLHFTDAVFFTLEQKRIKTANLTLHVGAGTFKPVKTETIGEHTMHAEWIEVTQASITQFINASLLIAVGTTSLRTLETLYWMGVKAIQIPDATLKELEIEQWDAYTLPQEIEASVSLNALLNWLQSTHQEKLICRTRLLIAPPYRLRLAKGIITNFHQPKSTLLLLISAVVGSNWKTIYEYALKNEFRFLSYGDSSLLMAD